MQYMRASSSFARLPSGFVVSRCSQVLALRTNGSALSRQADRPKRPGVGRRRCPVMATPATAAGDPAVADPRVMDGKKTAATVRGEIKLAVTELREKYGSAPGLAVVIVGTRKDSQTYVRSKRKACEEAGIESFLVELEENVSQDELDSVVDGLNGRPDVHGILVQLPLPSHIDTEAVLDKISLEKDVDGFHPLNIGQLCMIGREPLFVPCTPKGCLELLKRHDVDIEGKNAVVLGRSNIVGLPVAMLLMQQNATVTICHSRTKDLSDKIRQADILVAAVGRAEYVKGDWIKPGCVVIDVGINAVDDDTRKSGYRLVGDVEYTAAKQNAALITPVPGGVGPMTIAMLLSNTLAAATRAMENGAAE